MARQPQILAAIHASQAELAQYLTWVEQALDPAQSIADTQQAIDNFQQQNSELRYNIIDKRSDELLGAIGLLIRDASVPYFELGYWLATHATGQGYVTSAVTLLEQHAFNQLGAKRLEIRMAESNRSSRAVAERCGFPLEGTLLNERRLPSGPLCNTLVYAKTAL